MDRQIGQLRSNIRSWVESFPGLGKHETKVSIKVQPLYSSIYTTVLNGQEVVLLGINPGMEADYQLGLTDWNAHLDSYKAGLFGGGSTYHSYMDYHPRGRIVLGAENMVAKLLDGVCQLNWHPNQAWIRSVPTTNLILRATHSAKELKSMDEEPTSLPLLNFLHPKLVLVMGSDDRRAASIARSGMIKQVTAHRLPFPDARGRSIIVRSSETSWGGLMLAIPHSNALSGNLLQQRVGDWLLEHFHKI